MAQGNGDPCSHEGGKDSSTHESSSSSSSASIADNNAKAMTDLMMWQDDISMLELPPWSLSAQKSAKTVFFEENAKGLQKNGAMRMMMRTCIALLKV
jgi:hypothetical protein